jgi:hypothetical protein
MRRERVAYVSILLRYGQAHMQASAKLASGLRCIIRRRDEIGRRAGAGWYRHACGSSRMVTVAIGTPSSSRALVNRRIVTAAMRES